MKGGDPLGDRDDETVTNTVSPGDLGSSTDRSVGRYQLREVLGAGGMGLVYRAFDPALGREVAIKLVREARSGSAHSRILREAQTLARLRHPNIVPIFDVGRTETAIFLAMPVLDAGTLKSWLASEPRRWDAVLERFCLAGRGVAAAHDAGLVHRDFKPANVLLSADGQVQVADFGIARSASDTPEIPRSILSDHGPADMTRTGELIGTPAYMSPEQLRGERSDARSDQFSFCVALWAALFGERPFELEEEVTAALVPALLARIEAGPATPAVRRGMPRALRVLLARGLRIRPEERWPSMTELIGRLDALRRPRRRALWFFVASALFLAGVWLALWLQRDRSSTAPFKAPLNATRVKPVTRQGNVVSASVSPDGSKLAMVAGDALIWRNARSEDEDHTVVASGVRGVGGWSPDNRHVVAFIGPPGVRLNAAVVDLAERTVTPLPISDRQAIFVSGTVIASSDVERKEIVFTTIGASPAPPRSCPIPGEYAWISLLTRLSDEVMAVMVMRGDKSGSVLTLDKNCVILATYGTPEQSIHEISATDKGTLLALAARDGFEEIIELDIHGEVLSRRQIPGSLHGILGRRGGDDYVISGHAETRLVRYRGSASPVVEFSIGTRATFSPAPDGRSVAWIELGVEYHGMRGPLRVSEIAKLGTRSRPLLSNAIAVSWSPDGTRLAAVVDDGKGFDIAIVRAATGETERLGLGHLERMAPPLWLDDHTVAAQNDVHTNFETIDLSTGFRSQILPAVSPPADGWGWVFYPARSPKDGTVALMRNVAPVGMSLWLRFRDGSLKLLDGETVQMVSKRPFWNSAGELFYFDVQTGDVSQVDPETGRPTWIAALALQPGFEADDRMWFQEGDILLPQTKVVYDVALVVD